MAEKIEKPFFSFEFEVFGFVQGFYINLSFFSSQKIGVCFRSCTEEEAEKLSFLKSFKQFIL